MKNTTSNALKNMIYLDLEVEMENQINVGGQNSQQIGQNPVNQTTQISEKPMINYLVTGLVVFVCFILFGFGGYYLGRRSGQARNTTAINNAVLPTPNLINSPTPQTKLEDTMVNWKTYTNTNYGFSFKYPSEWNINVPPSFEGKHESNKTLLRIDVTNSLDFKNAALLGNKKDILNVGISVWDNENAKSFESVLAEWDNFFQNPKPYSTSIKEINQIKWTRRELINASGLPIIEFIALKGKYLYVVVVSPQDSTLIDFANQILSTFMFLN